MKQFSETILWSGSNYFTKILSWKQAIDSEEANDASCGLLWYFGLSPNSKHSHATFIPLLQGSPGYVVMTAITGASTLFSLYGTIVIVRAATPFLQQYRISMKFASFQLVLVLMNIQNLVFSILARYDLPSCIGSRGPEVRGSSRWILLLYFRAF